MCTPLPCEPTAIFDPHELKTCKGVLVPLKAKAEVQSRDETIEAYACEIPAKNAAKVLSVIKGIPHQQSINLQHLRRVANHGFLSAQLQATAQLRANSSVLSEPSEAAGEQGRPSTIFILICPASLVAQADLEQHFSANLPAVFEATRHRLFTVRVPLHAPSSEAEAAAHSANLWPTVYNPNTAYGPSPFAVAQVQSELQPNAGRWLALTRQLARESYRNGSGEPVGAVVVARDSNGVERIVCGAGDSRWARMDRLAQAQTETPAHGSQRSGQHDGNGNVAAHAVLRAIGMVARARRALASAAFLPSAPTTDAHRKDCEPDPRTTLDALSTPLESELYIHGRAVQSLQPNGYLCVDLTFYTTREPCVACCMALIHSRVANVVFAGPLRPRTGGFCVEGGGDGLGGYGLHWRKELNWRFLCWNFVEADDAGDEMRGLELPEEVSA